MPVSAEVESIAPELVKIRRAIHEHPEQGFKEEKTAALIRSKLSGWGVDHHPLCGTGTVALVKGAKPGPTILLRADIDALPLKELNDVPYASKVEGVMHACGHDGHAAMALGAARLLQKRRSSLRGNVKIMFQPAEEGPGGAVPMLEEGLLDGPKVDAAFAIHLWNDLPVGKVGVRSGPVFASTDEFRVRVIGRGGHGAAPHQTIDPVVVAAQIVVASQTIVSRNVDPVKTAVVTFGEVHGGTRHNIIPDVVLLHGTVRAFEPAVRKQLRADLTRIVRGIAASFGAKVELDYEEQYAPTINDPAMTEVCRQAATDALGKAAVMEQNPTMGAEDMSFVLERVPGCYMVLGSSNKKKGLVHPHHSAKFDFDEAALANGVEVWLRLAERSIS
jgi:amidohydrolase